MGKSVSRKNVKLNYLTLVLNYIYQAFLMGINNLYHFISFFDS